MRTAPLAWGLQSFFLMIGPANTFNAAPLAAQKVLHMEKASRMAGSMPVWRDAGADSSKIAVEKTFEQVLAEQTGRAAPDLLGYRAPDAKAQTGAAPQEPFGFGDLLDIINPLQHIPVLNKLYRDMTGDTIRAPARVMGGALFGGPLGAAGSLINVVVEEETGKDVAGNAVAFITQGKGPTYKSAMKQETSDPAKSLSAALAMNETKDDLPASLLAFADTGAAKKETRAQPLHNIESRYNA